MAVNYPMQLFDSFPKTRVLIVGDVMLDRYWWGTAARISPEAPVPIVKLSKSTLSAGGAANVAINVAGLGAIPILLGIVGVDSDADSIRRILQSTGVETLDIIGVENRPTTVKTRVIAHSQQVVRVDQERNDPISVNIEGDIEERLKTLVADTDVVVISDYAKGLLTNRLLNTLITEAKISGKSILVDPKGKDYTKYCGATLLTPNSREAAQACNLSEEDASTIVEIAGNRLLHELDIGSLLITQGEAGMTLFRHDLEAKHFPTAARRVYDVTGAGDTVIATLATAIGAGSDIETAVEIANLAAGVVVERIGTSAVTIEDIRDPSTGGSRLNDRSWISEIY